MKSPLVPLTLGLAVVAGAVAINVQQRTLQRDDMREIAGLRAELDSVRAVHVQASNGTESGRLAESVARRKYLLEQREYHVASRQAAIDSWWTLTGTGTAWSAVGALLLAAAALVGRRARAG